MARIFRAIKAVCPDVVDAEIAAAVYVRRDQKSPGLWIHTMPDALQMVVQQRTSVAPQPKCSVCHDTGVVLDPKNSALWCPAACASAEQQRHLDENFVDQWNAHYAETAWAEDLTNRRRADREARAIIWAFTASPRPQHYGCLQVNSVAGDTDVGSRPLNEWRSISESKKGKT